LAGTAVAVVNTLRRRIGRCQVPVPKFAGVGVRQNWLADLFVDCVVNLPAPSLPVVKAWGYIF